MSGTDEVRAAIRLAERKLPRKLHDDPPIGAPIMINGEPIKPGEWSPDLMGMPREYPCPVEPLGMEGDVLHCMDALGQLASVTPSAMGQKFIQRLFGDRQKYLYWAWPRFSAQGQVAGFRAEKVAEAFYSAAAKRGLFSAANKVRGRGAWRDARGGLIYHSGNALWRPGKRRARGKWDPDETGFVEGYFYPRRPDIPEPWPEPVTVENNPAGTLLEGLRRWNWERPDVDPVLALGHMCASMLGGALPWRPTGFLVGDKVTGKSSLQAIFKSVLGDGLVQSADTSAAGIYQHIGQDSLAVAVDELEGEADNRTTMAVVKLARLAASGALMLRGGQDHVGHEFRAQSCFLFSSINPPPLQPQDVSRMAMLRLKRLTDKQERKGLPVIDAETTGPMLLRRLFDEWHRFDQAFSVYREALRSGGHDGRGQDTFGVLLACADLALGPELADKLGVPMVDNTSDWAELLATRTMLEYEERGDNWLACLRHLLTSRVEAWRAGKRATVGQLLDDLAKDWDPSTSDPNRLQLSDANELLGQAGLKVMVPGAVDDGWVLAIPNESQLVAQQFRDTKWGGSAGASIWKSALRQGPASVICTDDRVNRVRINGVQVRCTLVRMRAFNEEAW